VSEPRNPSAKFWRETSALYKATSTTEKSYCPAIKKLWGRLLESAAAAFTAEELGVRK
jgi:hypothetical protein